MRPYPGIRRSTALLAAVALGTSITITAVPSSAAPNAGDDPSAQASPPESNFFSTVHIDEGATVGAPAVGDNREHGDLWPSCWSNDDNVYAAYGDGVGFGSTWNDIGVARISGTPGNLTGTQLAAGDQVGQVWTGPAGAYYRKPTGMVCVGGALYLAVQDLKTQTLDNVPAATILK